MPTSVAFGPTKVRSNLDPHTRCGGSFNHMDKNAGDIRQFPEVFLVGLHYAGFGWNQVEVQHRIETLADKFGLTRFLQLGQCALSQAE